MMERTLPRSMRDRLRAQLAALPTDRLQGYYDENARAGRWERVVEAAREARERGLKLDRTSSQFPSRAP